MSSPEAGPTPGSTVPALTEEPRAPKTSRQSDVRTRLSWIKPSRISAVFLWIGLMIIFSIWIPGIFLTVSTLKLVLYQQAVTALAAIGVTIALAAGVFDLSFASAIGLCGMLSAILISKDGLGVDAAIVVALACGLAIGLVNAFLITVLKIQSIIATLGVSSILAGLVIAVSGNEDVVVLNQGFSNLGTTTIAGVALSFWIMLVLAVVAWLVLERTPVGRYLYATGLNEEVSRLSGIRTMLFISAAAVVCALAAALAGVLATARVGAGDPTLGPEYLLPAYAAAFLGSTQIRPGYFNIWGTVLAVYVLATGVEGLDLAGAPSWMPAAFDGVALLLAVGFGALRAQLSQLVLIGRRSSVPAAVDD
jgi:ribose transport system permease protein